MSIAKLELMQESPGRTIDRVRRSSKGPDTVLDEGAVNEAGTTAATTGGAAVAASEVVVAPVSPLRVRVDDGPTGAGAEAVPSAFDSPARAAWSRRPVAPDSAHADDHGGDGAAHGGADDGTGGDESDTGVFESESVLNLSTVVAAKAGEVGGGAGDTEEMPRSAVYDCFQQYPLHGVHTIKLGSNGLTRACFEGVREVRCGRACEGVLALLTSRGAARCASCRRCAR